MKTDQNFVNKLEEYPKGTTRIDLPGSSSHNDEETLLTLKRIDDGDDFNSILEYLRKELQKNWSDRDMNILETIELAELNQEEKNWYLQSLRKV